ncbi:MAG: cytochrome c, partial [Chthoniobacteraceae bacterium]
MSQGSENIDSRESADLTEVHAAIQRENKDPSADVTPVPMWVTMLCGVAVCWAGAYVGMFHGGFDSNVYNEFESSPAVLFPQPERANAKAGPAVPEDMVAIGKGVYLGNCQACHTANGAGQPGLIPPVAGSEWVKGNEKRITMILLKGLMGPVKVNNATYNGVMPPWEGSLNDKKIAAVLTYIRQEWGNKAGAITPAQVTAARKEFSAKKVSWSEAELLQIPDDAKLEGGAPAGGAPPAPATPSSEPPVAATPAASVPADSANAADAGKTGYMTVCIACHQPTGQGLPGAFPSLVNSEYVNGSPERLTSMVLKGINPPFKYKDVTYLVPMIPQEAVLADDKIAAILTFVRSSFENSAPPITTEFVANV